MVKIDELLNKKMTKKQFLNTLGLGVVGVMGVPAALKLLEGSAGATGVAPKRTGLVCDLRAVRGWSTGDPSGIFPADPKQVIFPAEHYENYHTKIEAFNLFEATGIMEQLERVKARQATKDELLRVHSQAHIDKVNEASAKERGALVGGFDTPIGHNGHIIAELAFGGAIDLAMGVWKRNIKNGYVLMRPPGHHATKELSMGFCIYNNLAGAAAALLADGAKKLLVLDWDVHYGNGTYDIFKDDKRVVIVDMHQRECFPPGAGHITERGVKNVLNINLPPGSGHQSALYAMEKVVVPAIKKHNPEMILVASGFDSGLTDPLGRFMFGPQTYREMTKRLMDAAANPTCQGRIAMFHEGGYDRNFVPECALAVIEQLSGANAERPSQYAPVVDWMNAGITPEILAVHRDIVDEVAALVPDIPS